VPLTGKQRRHLRALGHALDPVLTIGAGGVTDAVVRELQGALHAHELVKVRMLRTAPAQRAETAAELGRRAGAEIAQVLGRTALLFKARLKDPSIKLPPAP
jgi:RNA-binding protein